MDPAIFERFHRYLRVVGYVDLDYVGDFDKRRSLTGYIFIIVFGCTISWKAILQQ